MRDGKNKSGEVEFRNGGIMTFDGGDGSWAVLDHRTV